MTGHNSRREDEAFLMGERDNMNYSKGNCAGCLGEIRGLPTSGRKVFVPDMAIWD